MSEAFDPAKELRDAIPRLRAFAISLSGRSAWERLFEEQVSTISVELDGGTTTLEAALARLHAPDRPAAARTEQGRGSARPKA